MLESFQILYKETGTVLAKLTLDPSFSFYHQKGNHATTRSPWCCHVSYYGACVGWLILPMNTDEKFNNMILATMLYLDSVDSSKKLYLYIRNSGRDLTPSMAIYDTMQSLKISVGTQCLGFAYNLAEFLLAAGEKGSRIGMPLCRISLQSSIGAAHGQVGIWLMIYAMKQMISFVSKIICSTI